MIDRNWEPFTLQQKADIQVSTTITKYDNWLQNFIKYIDNLKFAFDR